MPNYLKPLGDLIAALSFSERLGENADTFITEVTYINFIRVRIMAAVALVLFTLLGILDVLYFLQGKWAQSSGYAIVTYTHFILIVFLAGLLILTRGKTPPKPSTAQSLHKAISDRALIVVLACTLFLTVGDVMTNGSIAAYLGMVFAFAAIFVMTNRYSLILFGINMLAMIILLFLVQMNTGQPMNIQVVNTVSFTVAAFILSRVLFFYTLKDFANRQLIKAQSKEIVQKNKMQAELIGELKSALDKVKTLSGFLPICAGCKKIRDDKGYWNQIEAYLQEHSDAEFSHGLCPECMDKMYADQSWYENRLKKNGN